MSKPFTNPFFEADISKMFDMSSYWQNCDVSKMFDVSKLMGDYKWPQGGQIPSLDMEAFVALQRKNIEALTSINQATWDTMQALVRRQADSLRQMVEDSAQMSQALMSCSTPESKVIKQAEASKAALDKYLSNLRDASETVAKCNSQAMETVGARLNESLSEICGMVKNASAA